MGVCRLALIAALFMGCGADAVAAPLRGKVTYAKSGGIAGIVQKLTVTPDGHAVAASSRRKRSFKLSRAQLQALTTAVAKARLEDTKDPKSMGQGADGFSYRVAYHGDDVRWDDFTDQPPRRVLTLYRLLDELYEAHTPCPSGRSC
jgi:uncharacterized protein YbjT (DUF2867 family)